MSANDSIVDIFPYVYKSTDERIQLDRTGWDEVFEPTYTSTEHSRRLIIEWAVDTISIFSSLALCIYLWYRKRLMVRYAHSITFITFGGQILYWPFYILSTWQTMFLLFGKIPVYPTILHCTILRHCVIACFQSAGLITVPVAVNRMVLMFRKKQVGIHKMVAMQIAITFVELGFTLGHLAIGNVTLNDVCAKWIASTKVFLISMTVNNSLLVATVVINVVILITQFFYQIKMTGSLMRQTTIPMAIMGVVQSSTELGLSYPLTLRQWKVLLSGIRPRAFFCKYGYMFSFSCVFMVPLISMICIPDFRKELWKTIRCQKEKQTNHDSEHSVEIHRIT